MAAIQSAQVVSESMSGLSSLQRAEAGGTPCLDSFNAASWTQLAEQEIKAFPRAELPAPLAFPPLPFLPDGFPQVSTLLSHHVHLPHKGSQLPTTSQDPPVS